ncbi:hypothetical protein, partial [Ruminococcus sp.]|uniref:hypothetical protein n=1 Tax=Ruminococcus sp. TaxID=41978 RepID=UPI00257C15BE
FHIEEIHGLCCAFFTAPFCVRKLCAIFVGRIDILRAVGNLAVNGPTLFAPTKIYIIIVFYQYIYVGERRNFFV